MAYFKVLTISNPKTIKGVKRGYLPFILHLAPHRLSGVATVCPMVTLGCSAACLNTAGRGGMMKRGETTNAIQEARKRKTRLLFSDREAFLASLVQEVGRAIRAAIKRRLTPVFRLNGTSDLRWEIMPVKRDGAEYPSIFHAFPEVQFYDYTKLPNRRVANIPNYHLTFSLADGNESHAAEALAKDISVAAVFRVKRGAPLPNAYMGRPVIDGDDTDLRFLDPPGVIISLRAKGKAIRDTSGFVKDVAAVSTANAA